jgi:hypothetical protein
MLAVTYADLWFRSRQFFIALIGVEIVCTPALGRSGLTVGHGAAG